MTSENGIGEILRLADITAPAEVPAERSGPGFDPVEWEGVLKLVERFVRLFERAGEVAGRLRNVEWYSEGGARPPLMEASRAEPAMSSSGSSKPPIPALKAYQLALGFLARVPGDMTVAQMLEYARSNKALILPILEAELKGLQDD